jgi:cupin fold WbuC family metalloprotein
MSLTKKSAEVYMADGPISVVDAADVELLRKAVVDSPRGRVRINIHPSAEDQLHEMFIGIRRDSYIRPHKHPGKSEAFHVVHGVVDIVVFNDAGEIAQVVPLANGDQGQSHGDGHGSSRPGRAFYYRMSSAFFHTLVIRSDILVVHEITNGPFEPGGTQFGSFSPEEADTQSVARYQRELLERVAAFTASEAT